MLFATQDTNIIVIVSFLMIAPEKANMESFWFQFIFTPKQRLTPLGCFATHWYL